MEKLLEQAQKLVADLNAKLAEVANQKAVLDKQAESQAVVSENLRVKQAELAERESAIQPIENAQKIIEDAQTIKAEADLQASKVAGEWGALKAAKHKHDVECQAERTEINEQRELYNRGAKENAITKQKLDDKLAKFREASA
jgi:hypothetical protein